MSTMNTDKSTTSFSFDRRSPRTPLLGALLLAGGMGALSLGCYGIDFDEARADVYYCQIDSECLATQACAEFRCVDNTGPALNLTLPEALTPFAADEQTLVVNFDVKNFSLSDSASNVDGTGKVAIAIDGERVNVTDIAGAQLELGGSLGPGAHQLSIQAVFGDESTLYTNPSASDFTTFYIQDVNPAKPQVAIVSPGQGHVHVVGEPLVVEAAVRNFVYVENNTECQWEDDCDPYAIGAECSRACEPEFDQGHSHAYIIDRYPDCLDDTPLGCNGKYALSMRLSEGIEGDEDEVRGVIPGDRFTEAGPLELTVTLQYSAHDPFPNQTFVIFDQITIDVVDP